MECKCYADSRRFGEIVPRLVKCPLCESAPELYEKLKGLSTVIHNAIRGTEGGYRVSLQQQLREIAQILAKAEGGK